MRTGLKSLAATLCTVTLAVAATACGSGSNGGSDTASGNDLAEVSCPLSALPKSGDKVKIDLWYGGLSGKAKQVMTAMAKSYNASQDRVEVTASDQGAAYTQITAKYTQAIPDRIPSIVYTASNDAQYLADSGTIIPGGACADAGVVPLDHIIPVVRNFYSLSDVFVPAAVNVSTPQLYYNKKQYKEAGLPQRAPGTLAEMKADAEKLKAAGISGLEWPVSMTVNRWYFETFLNGIGQNLVNHDDGHDGRATAAVFDTPEAVKLMETLKSMYDEGLIAKISNTPGQLDQYLNVAQGKSAMLIETSTAATTIEAFLGGELSAADLEAGNLEGLSKSTTLVPGFGEMPGIDNPGQIPISGGAFYVTNGGTKAQQAAAMDFMRYVNEVPQQVRWHLEGSYLPSNDQVAQQPEVKKFWKGDIAGLSLKTASEQLAETDPDRPGPVVGPFDQYDQIIQKMMEAVLLKDADPATELKKAQSEVTKAIKDYNAENGF